MLAFRVSVVICGIAVADLLVPSAIAESRFVVTDFGASGKAKPNATDAFQRAVDACHTAGGGTVDVPAGQYTLGTVLLKDNVAININAGAVVFASTEPGDYLTSAGAPDSNYRRKDAENVLTCRRAVFYAYRAKNIALTGRGKLVGNGQAFWTMNSTDDYPKWKSCPPWHYCQPKPIRPMMLTFEDCEDVLIHEIKIADSPCYSGWIIGCKQVKIVGVAVLNNMAGKNTDGFHFSSCENVHVSDCDFVCGDDCIAIDPNHRGPASHFTISDCTFKTTVAAIRIFCGLDPGYPKNAPRGKVSDVAASNCTVSDASTVFNIVAERGDIERIAFSNFTIDMKQRGSTFFFLTVAGGTIRNVILNNMTVRTDGLGTISGEDGGQISNVTIAGLRCDMHPRTKLYGNGMPDPLPGFGFAHFAPYNFYFRHARDIKLVDTQVNWCEADLEDISKVPGGKTTWSCVECRDVDGLDIDGVVCSPYGDTSAAMEMADVKNVSICRCKAQPKTKIFLHLADKVANASLTNNNLLEARTAIELAPGVSADAVFVSGNLTGRPQQRRAE